MSRILYFIAAFIFISLSLGSICVGQKNEGESPSKSLSRKEKRELIRKTEKIVDSLNLVSAKEAIDCKKWSLEVKTISDKNEMPVQIDNPRNIISMRGETASIHLSSKYDAMNKKGIGAISVNGPVVDYSKTVDKKGLAMIRYVVFGKGRNAEVVLTLQGKGNLAYGEIESPTTGKKIRFSGNLVQLENKKNFKKK
jgi:hypothetical protein